MMRQLPASSHWISICLAALLALTVPTGRATGANDLPPPPELPPILSLDEVGKGMKGYGLSVFEGTKIEPFPVEVISVQRDYRPKSGIIWIRCTGERMQKFGVVQGMSGSPIYLWGKDEPKELGKGGLLIGAFALGFPLSKDCIVGVQPVELMRQVNDRAKVGAVVQAAAGNRGPSASTVIADLLSMAREQGLSTERTWRAQALYDLVRGPESDLGDVPDRRRPRPSIPGPTGFQGKVVPLLLPVNVGSLDLAQLLEPLLARMGMTPIASPIGIIAGLPPKEIDPKAIRFAPGSVLSIPLAWGDMELSASGTVTEVLPDGRITAFGHAMFGEGPVAIPIATGYIHMVIPRITMSFKQGGSGVIRGALVRDENSAVVGSRDGTFTSAPVKIDVTLPDHPRRQYRYEVAHHKRLTPVLAAIVAMQSIGAVQDAPDESTLKLNAQLLFDGDRKLNIRSIMPRGSGIAVAFELIPPLATMAQNQFESMMLQSLTATIDIQPQVQMAVITHAQLDKAEVAPGDTLWATLRIKPYGKKPVHKRFGIKVPQATPDGSYTWTICDAQAYLQLLFRNRPHLRKTNSADELHRVIQRIMDVHEDDIHLLLQLGEQGLAIGQHEMGRLPSSRKALMVTPTNTLATSYKDWVEKRVPTQWAIRGSRSFKIAVRKELAKRREGR